MFFPFFWAIFADLRHIFSFLTEISGLSMPKYSICDGDSWTEPEQDMDAISQYFFFPVDSFY